MPWDKERLMEVARMRLDGARLVVVANREPFIHVYHGEAIAPALENLARGSSESRWRSP